MSIRKVELVSGEYYHIYNRGNSKQKIFLDKEDYLRFVALLYACNQKGNLKVNNLNKGQSLYDLEREGLLVSVAAYCLMPNHFHLLVTQSEDNNISAFMQKLSTSYSMYFNKKYKRTGSLFEGKFKSKSATYDPYLKYLFSYIHLNPLKLKYSDWKTRIADSANLLEIGNKYPFSSYQDYTQDIRNESMILSKEFFPQYFSDKASWENEMIEWIKYVE